MFRGIFWVIAISLSIQLVCSDLTSSKNLEANKDLMLDLDVLASPNLHKRELGTVLLLIKNQIREIIEETITNLFSIVKNILYQFKMSVLKKFESYTMANLLRIIINGFTDMTSDVEVPELSYDEVEVEQAIQFEPVQVETYGYRNPYYSSGLATLFRDKRQKHRS